MGLLKMEGCMGRNLRAITGSRIPRWPYPELKDVPDAEIFNFLKKASHEGNAYRMKTIREHEREYQYKSIGRGIIYGVVIYFTTIMLFILLAVFVAYRIKTWKPV